MYIKKRYECRRKSKEKYTGFAAGELEAFSDHQHKRKFSPKTIDHRERSVKDLFAFLTGRGVARLQDVTPDDLEAYRLSLVDRPCKQGTIESYLWSARTFFTWLEKTQRLFVNPTENLTVKRPRKQILPVPTEEEMRKLLAHPDTTKPVGLRDRALLETLYCTGVRRGELLNMKIFDPDFDRGMIRVLGKGKKERILPLGKQAVHWLKQYMREARRKMVKDQIDVRALWVSKDGDPLSDIRVDQMVRLRAKEACIETPISLHGIRRACATHMLAHGAHPVQLQMLLGHSSLQTLSHYLQVGIKQMMKTHHNCKPGK